MAEPNPFVVTGRLVIIHSPQPVIAVNFGIDRSRRFAHPCRGELPVMSGVERRRVENQDWDFRRAPPIVVPGMETVRLALGLDFHFIQPSRRAVLAVLDPREYVLLVQFADPPRA